MWFICSLQPAGSTPCLLPTSPHGDAVGTVFGAEPSNCTGGTFARVDARFTGAPSLKIRTRSGQKRTNLNRNAPRGSDVLAVLTLNFIAFCVDFWRPKLGNLDVRENRHHRFLSFASLRLNAFWLRRGRAGSMRFALRGVGCSPWRSASSNRSNNFQIRARQSTKIRHGPRAMKTRNGNAPRGSATSGMSRSAYRMEAGASTLPVDGRA